MFRQVTDAPPAVILGIAVVATLNTIIVQIIMASRVVYGLADQGNLPAVFARINAVTRTPLVATSSVVAVILVLALAFPLEGLAEMTSRITLTVFALVNIALIKLKLAGDPAPEGVFEVQLWVPVAGVLASIAFLMSGYLVG